HRLLEQESRLLHHLCLKETPQEHHKSRLDLQNHLLVLVVLMIIEMDRNQQFNELELQQASLFVAPLSKYVP
ncbi:mitochondrial import receptor subunit tom9-2, partial [Phtheirospermum japonicum]